MIVRGTTPSIRFTFNAIQTTDITVAVLTVFQNGEVLFEKSLSDGNVGEGYIEWALTQEETLGMSPDRTVNIQCRYKLNDGSAYATQNYELTPYDVINEEVI